MTEATKTQPNDEAANAAVSAQDLRQWGAGFWAYARPIRVDGQDMVAIFDADGARLGLVSDLAAARIAMRENDLEPMTVH